MKTKGFVISGVVALLVLVLVGAYYLWGDTSGVPKYAPPAKELPGQGVTGNASSDTDPFDVTITYGEKGFAPADIVVAQGTRVRFINASKEPVWPASGVHPTHTLYPEKGATDCLGSTFDACKALAPGEFYDFTFYYVGNWSFHDHAHAYNTGSVTVTAP